MIDDYDTAEEPPAEMLSAVNAAFAAFDRAYAIRRESDRARAMRQEHLAALKAERAAIVREHGLTYSTDFGDSLVAFRGRCAGCHREVPHHGGRLTMDEQGRLHVWCTEVAHWPGKTP